MSESKTSKTKVFPNRRKRKDDWVPEYFQASLEDMQRLINVLAISANGITRVQNGPKELDALLSYNSYKEKYAKDENEAKEAKVRKEITEKNRTHVFEQAELAKSEVVNGFPTLNGFGVLALWSWLETFVVDFLVLWVRHNPASMYGSDIPKIRVDLKEFVALRGEARARFIVERILGNGGVSEFSGAGKFDPLLSSFGFKILLNDETRRNIYEFQQVRNCLAHRFGVVDRRLVASCSWLNLKVGKPLSVSSKMIDRYGDACSLYLLELLYMAGERYGRNLRPPEGK